MAESSDPERGLRDELRAGFRAPPPSEYGDVPFWWWDGDELSEDRITDQLETLKARGVEAVCFEQKYPHGSPEGPQVPYFSEEWWGYMAHTAEECDRLGMALWIHDLTYHHSPPRWKRYWQNQVEDEIDDRPEFQGRVIDRVSANVAPGETATLALEAEFDPLSVAAYPVDDGALEVEDAMDLESALEDESGGSDADGEGGRRLEWTAPEAGDAPAAWHVAAVGTRPEGLCRTSRAVVDRILERHYGAYVERLGEHLGESIVGTFQDELFILQGSIPCDERLLARYEAEWGEDPTGDLIALFEDCGPETPGIRARYWDVVVTMLEENWFRPLHEWHERRGLRFAHDNWGRNDLTEHATEYGDYVRTMRWFQEPGYDDGGSEFEGVGTRNFFDGKLASSIAECYGRERVWGELLHTTGWGLPLDLHFAAVAENACYGLDHYNKHGLYYATLGGWYEHAPPDTHFRQPYWEHAEAFNDAVTRLMYLCAQGDRVVDLAMAYPITSIQAHRLADTDPAVDGSGDHHRSELEDEADEIDEATRELSEALYTDVADLLFVDDDTLAESHVADGRLAFAGSEAEAFVLGPASTVRRATLETTADLVDDGGVVVSLGRLPTATVEGGRDDPHLPELLRRIFGEGLDAWRDAAGDPAEPIVVERADESGTDAGVAVLAAGTAGLAPVLDRYIDRDVRAPADVYHAHRRVGDRDVYLLLNTREEARTLEIDLRATGRPERFDVHEGTADPLYAFEQREGYTTITLEFAPHEFHLVAVDGSRDAGASVLETSLADLEGVATDDGISVAGYATRSGAHEATVDAGDEVREAASGPVDVPEPIALDEGWTFDLDPTLDNRWGDVRYPASDDPIGAEVKEFDYRSEHAGPGERVDGLEAGWDDPETADAAETNVADGWETTRATYGPYVWRRTGDADPDAVATPPESTDGWAPDEFSTEIGKPGTHPDDHGLNGVVSDDFLVAGDEPTHFWTTVSGAGERVACHHGAGIDALLVDGERVPLGDDPGTLEVALPAGPTPVHVVVEPDTQTHVVFEPLPATARERDMAYVPRLRWFHDGAETGDGADGAPALAFDAFPWLAERVDWFRFEAPVGATGFSLPIAGDLRVWLDGEERDASEDRVDLDAPLEAPATVVVRSDAVGSPGGARWDGPVQFETAPVDVETGDWCALGLREYSGVGVYRRTVTAPDLASGDRLVLDLGDVGVSAAVLADGEQVGTVFAAPYEVDLTDAAVDADGEPLDLEIRVANTIANHFATETPTRYVYDGQRRSGLFGPVELRVERGVTIDLAD